jgi:hypothetical protein
MDKVPIKPLLLYRLKRPESCDENIEILVAEVDQELDNDFLHKIGEFMLGTLVEKGNIGKTDILIVAFIKHFFKSTKKVILCQTDEAEKIGQRINKDMSESNKLIQDFLRDMIKEEGDQEEMHQFSVNPDGSANHLCLFGPVKKSKYEFLGQFFPSI